MAWERIDSTVLTFEGLSCLFGTILSTSLFGSIHVLLRSSFNSEVMGSFDSDEHDEVRDICGVEGVVTGSGSVVDVEDDDDEVEETVVEVVDVGALVDGASLK